MCDDFWSIVVQLAAPIVALILGVWAHFRESSYKRDAEKWRQSRNSKSVAVFWFTDSDGSKGVKIVNANGSLIRDVSLRLSSVGNPIVTFGIPAGVVVLGAGESAQVEWDAFKPSVNDPDLVVAQYTDVEGKRWEVTDKAPAVLI